MNETFNERYILVVGTTTTDFTDFFALEFVALFESLFELSCTRSAIGFFSFLANFDVTDLVFLFTGVVEEVLLFFTLDALFILINFNEENYKNDENFPLFVLGCPFSCQEQNKSDIISA